MMRPLDPERITRPIRQRLNTDGFAHPKPAPSVKQQPKDGRLIETPHQYRVTKRQMWIAQNRKCANCPRFLPSPAFGHRHHVDGRGLGSGKRSDDKTVILCIPCHEKEHENLGPQWSRTEKEG